jgi:polysaccharide deacetylase family protein (PEP-CTERM system associated)
VSDPSVLNALTVDVEDWFQVSAFEDVMPRSDWDRYERRVARNTARLLDLFEARGARATFFVLGWVADREPALLREIVDAGHEVASHGYEHRLVAGMDPAEFRRDLRRAQHAIETACGVRTKAFRAPSFSFSRDCTWAYEILMDEGYTLSSSVFPVRHDRYGIPDFPRRPVRVQDADGREILEVPMTTWRAFGRNLPVSGGGWMRVLPPGLMRHAFRRANAERLPAVLYLHPWEIDPGQPDVPQAPRMSRWRHRVNLSRMESRLDALLRRFPFGTLGEAVACWQAHPPSDPRSLRLPSLSWVEEDR